MQSVISQGRVVELSLAGSKVNTLGQVHIKGISHPRGTTHGIQAAIHDPQTISHDLVLQKTNQALSVLPRIRMSPLCGGKTLMATPCIPRTQHTQAYTPGCDEPDIIVLDPERVPGHDSDAAVGDADICLSKEGAVLGILTPSTVPDDTEALDKEDGHMHEPQNHSSSYIESSIKSSKQEKRRRRRKKSKHSKRSKSSVKQSTKRKPLKSVSHPPEAGIDPRTMYVDTLVPLQSHGIKVLPSSQKQYTPKPKIIYPEMLKSAINVSSPRPTKQRPFTKNSSSSSKDLQQLDIFSAYSNQRLERGQTLDILQIYANQGAVHPTVHSTKPTKVYLSERQSRSQKELGQEFPCPPPATPIPAFLDHYEFVPCLSDIKSQRAVKVRLEAINKVERKRIEKLRQEKQQKEKERQREEELDLRKRQRLEIYALNKVMTELEHTNFMSFCESHGLKNGH